jgi:hypothetical protein
MSNMLMPRIIEARKACTTAKITIMGASQVYWFLSGSFPEQQFQNIQSRKLPSWPSQKQEII